MTAVSLTGCDNGVFKPKTEGIKIGELAPAGKRVKPQVLRTTNIDVVTFEIPAENIGVLANAWKMLDPATIRYTDPESFSVNKLRAAEGKFGDLDKIYGTLNLAKAKKESTTTLLIQDNQPEIFNMGRLANKTTISYIGVKGAVNTAEVGPAILGLSVNARKIAQDRAIATVRVMPVIFAETDGLAPALARRLKENDIRFFWAGFMLHMKPGDVLMLGPAEFNPDEKTVAGRFFTKTGQNASVKVLILVCTSVN